MLLYCTAIDDTLPGFIDYSYKHVLPACFNAPLEASFDLNDGHSFLVSCQYRCKKQPTKYRKIGGGGGGGGGGGEG